MRCNPSRKARFQIRSMTSRVNHFETYTQSKLEAVLMAKIVTLRIFEACSQNDVFEDWNRNAVVS